MGCLSWPGSDCPMCGAGLLIIRIAGLLRSSEMMAMYVFCLRLLEMRLPFRLYRRESNSFLTFQTQNVMLLMIHISKSLIRALQHLRRFEIAPAYPFAAAHFWHNI